MYLTPEQKQQFEKDGYIILRGLMSRAEGEGLRDHFMDLHAEGPKAGLFEPKTLEQAGGDILQAYPRFMHPHRVDPKSVDWMLDDRFRQVLADIMGEEPIASQSMFYYKPAGARGQALHQDNFYLDVAPGTCYAVWVALDKIDEENGGLFVVPGSHRTKVQCPHVADLTKSFTTEEVDVPEGMAPVPVPMEIGDVLFFAGNLIHGSFPNTSTDRFRRSFICHYLGEKSTQISRWYFPLLRFDGTRIEADDVYEASEGGDFCGKDEWNALYKARPEQEKVVFA